MAEPVWESTQTDYDWQSGTPEPTWIGDCATWNPFEIWYGQFGFTPSSGSTWATGYRPSSLTITGTDIGTWLTANGTVPANDGYVDYDGGSYTLDLTGVANGDDSFTLPIVLAGDILGVRLLGDVNQTLEICDVVWGNACTSFWTNHLSQQEVTP